MIAARYFVEAIFIGALERPQAKALQGDTVIDSLSQWENCEYPTIRYLPKTIIRTLRVCAALKKFAFVPEWDLESR